MRLLDELRNLRRAHEVEATLDRTRDNLAAVLAKNNRTEGQRRTIGINLTAYNRATRRLYGFFGRAVPLEFVQPESTYFVPRYLRRHRLASTPVTRRQRRVRARSIRLVTRYQLQTQKVPT